MDKYFVCRICGHIEFNAAPDNCPVCGALKDNFNENPDAIMPAEKEGKEKHVPDIAVTNACGLIPDDCRDIHVKIGSTPHPMVEDHSIQWIDIYINKKYSARYFLTYEFLQPVVGLHLKKSASGTLTIVSNCNKHGNWIAEAAI